MQPFLNSKEEETSEIDNDYDGRCKSNRCSSINGAIEQFPSKISIFLCVRCAEISLPHSSHSSGNHITFPVCSLTSYFDWEIEFLDVEFMPICLNVRGFQEFGFLHVLRELLVF